MSTSYYLKTGKKLECPHCECLTVDDELRIGRSSGGWVFALNIFPSRGINELDDWEELFKKYPIYDECGVQITPDDMVSIIAKRPLWGGTRELKAHDSSYRLYEGDGTMYGKTYSLLGEYRP